MVCKCQKRLIIRFRLDLTFKPTFENQIQTLGQVVVSKLIVVCIENAIRRMCRFIVRISGILDALKSRSCRDL